MAKLRPLVVHLYLLNLQTFPKFYILTRDSLKLPLTFYSNLTFYEVCTLHGKNGFAECSKILTGYRSESNFVGPSK